MSRPSIVVVGNGMAGHRVVEKVRAADPQRLLDVTVISAEPTPAYNRVLLSEALAGRHRVADIGLTPPGWHADHGVTLYRSTEATAIERTTRTVCTSDGRDVRYDTLVLATGSTPRLPPIAHLDTESGLIEGAHLFRTAADCESILSASETARRAVVLGGGLLGIEAARGLAGRGVPVVVVHAAHHLMERQLDPAAGRILTQSLEAMGINVRLGATAHSVIRDRSGRFGGLGLSDGSCVLGDLLVISAGVRPNVDLARQAGLPVEQAIVVDDAMRSISDERVYAVGECAQHRGALYGLVAPAWEQADVVAARITGSDPQRTYSGSRLVTRLKADGVDLASMGDPLQDTDGLDVVQVADPGRNTYAKVLVRDDRIVGAIVLGQVTGLGTLTTLFDSDRPLPYDRLSLLLPVDAAGGEVARASTPATMPGSAVVCRCNGVTKATIQAAVLAGARTVPAVATRTRATTGCGGCTDAVCGIVDWLNAADPEPIASVSRLTEMEEVS